MPGGGFLVRRSPRLQGGKIVIRYNLMRAIGGHSTPVAQLATPRQPPLWRQRNLGPEHVCVRGSAGSSTYCFRILLRGVYERVLKNRTALWCVILSGYHTLGNASFGVACHRGAPRVDITEVQRGAAARAYTSYHSMRASQPTTPSHHPFLSLC